MRWQLGLSSNRIVCRLWRLPLRLNPESIIQGSGLEALQVTAFLAENYPYFLADEAMEETAAAAAYLSDAGMGRSVHTLRVSQAAATE